MTKATKKAFIVEKADLEPHVGTVAVGHPNLTAYGFLNEGLVASPGHEVYCLIALDDINPGGGIAEHYHSNEKLFHHVYYVISGQVLASVEGMEPKIVGSDTLIYCQSNVKHSIKNVGRSIAKVLRISAQTEKDRTETMVLSNKQV